MNERIAKLYDQAIVIEDGGDYVCGELDPEKFAELIVRECVAICQDVDGEDSIEAKSGRQDCAVEIRDHFGVEE